ncbi:MAG: L-seryl-tRNA(Sec) selenium transferase [Alicyclobacillaceae bacterium]|uniref:L-seryl-tRNA(Sec) selenium transferase n=1 Tax=Alicyclobacillus sp. SP_1 TaxID=2942475 RepID=UPI00215761CD|nr:L-seryl-tRNA(Sec) selenium transferase [Alicyclobacillus sp. SP_1]MCY0888422.1 L-seryl-tRNA(Sec) selenium transferase [Alicyclobacillaceae bacterium]
MDKTDVLRHLPAVHRLLAAKEAKVLLEEYPSTVVRIAFGEELQRLREYILALEPQADSEIDERTSERSGRNHLGPVPQWVSSQIDIPAIVQRVAEQLARKYAPSLRPVLNLTGVVIHTNLGRAPLSARALQSVVEVAQGYSTLEFQVEEGARSSRHVHVERRICDMTGAEAALVVNNNAAAVFLVLQEMAEGGEAIVSRGQLVEIGGAFRVPDIMAQSGVELVEVGTTNKTRLNDYERAMSERTRLLVRVHTSNFRIVGFTEEPDLVSLAQLAHRYQIPLFEDLGSGALFDYAERGIGDEPTVAASIAAGVDIVTFSGDKLLGGAQAGIVVGRRSYIDRMKKHPLLRALRPDKMTLAALEATLIDHQRPHPETDIPVLRMLTESVDDLLQRANAVMDLLEEHRQWLTALHFEVCENTAKVGGGALPLVELPSVAIRIASEKVGATTLSRLLRTVPDVPIIARIEDDAVWLDVRTLLPGQEFLLAKGLADVGQSLVSRELT